MGSLRPGGKGAQVCPLPSTKDQIDEDIYLASRDFEAGLALCLGNTPSGSLLDHPEHPTQGRPPGLENSVSVKQTGGSGPSPKDDKPLQDSTGCSVVLEGVEDRGHQKEQCQDLLVKKDDRLSVTWATLSEHLRICVVHLLPVLEWRQCRSVRQWSQPVTPSQVTDLLFPPHLSFWLPLSPVLGVAWCTCSAAMELRRGEWLRRQTSTVTLVPTFSWVPDQEGAQPTWDARGADGTDGVARTRKGGSAGVNNSMNCYSYTNRNASTDGKGPQGPVTERMSVIEVEGKGWTTCMRPEVWLTIPGSMISLDHPPLACDSLKTFLCDRPAQGDSTAVTDPGLQPRDSLTSTLDSATKEWSSDSMPPTRECPTDSMAPDTEVNSINLIVCWYVFA